MAGNSFLAACSRADELLRAAVVASLRLARVRAPVGAAHVSTSHRRKRPRRVALALRSRPARCRSRRSPKASAQRGFGGGFGGRGGTGRPGHARRRRACPAVTDRAIRAAAARPARSRRRDHGPAWRLRAGAVARHRRRSSMTTMTLPPPPRQDQAKQTQADSNSRSAKADRAARRLQSRRRAGERRFVPNEVLLNVAGGTSAPALDAIARRHRLTRLEAAATSR